MQISMLKNSLKVTLKGLKHWMKPEKVYFMAELDIGQLSVKLLDIIFDLLPKFP